MAADLTEDHLVQCTNTLDLQSQVQLSATHLAGLCYSAVTKSVCYVV